MTDTLNSREIAFKRTADGWVFAPAVLALGPMLGSRLGTSYLLNDAQKAEIGIALAGMRRANGAICLTYAVLCGFIAVAMFGLLIWHLFGPLPQLPPLPRISGAVGVGLIALIFVPLALSVAWYGRAMQRALAGAARSAERISAREYITVETAATSMNQIRLQFALSIFLSIVFFNQLARGIASGQLGFWILWSLLLIVCVGAAVRWARMMKLKRAIESETPSNS